MWTLLIEVPLALWMGYLDLDRKAEYKQLKGEMCKKRIMYIFVCIVLTSKNDALYLQKDLGFEVEEIEQW